MTESEAPRRRRRWVRVVAIIGAVVVVLAIGAAVYMRHALRASLPVLDGELTVEGLSGPVTITRDARGIPHITGDRLDIAFATGFVHAQDRFFQMDLMRRSGAGELSALFGEAALELDKSRRLNRSRHIAEQALAQASDRHRALIERYAAGVNAGLAALDGASFEYRLMGVEPRPWEPVDTMLSLIAVFYDMLDESARHDRMRGALYEAVPGPLADWLTARGTTRWDAAIDGTTFPDPPMPGPEVVDLRRMDAWSGLKDGARAPVVLDGYGAASNAWAISGQRTAHGHALLAGDPHMTLRLPPVWYRVAWSWTEGGETRRIEGASLPGGPVVVIGTNGHVAWSLTNSRIDSTDAVRLVLEGDGYRTPDGVEAFVTHTDTIEVAGGEPVEFEYRWTRWGPVVDAEHDRPFAVQWSGHRPDAVNMSLVDMEQVADVEAALEVAAGGGTPSLNVIVADASGRIGWTIMGYIAERFGPSPAAAPAPAAPTPAEPTAAEPTAAEPTAAEPTAAEPTAAEPTPAEPTAAEPTAAESTAAPGPADPAPSPLWSGYDSRVPHDGQQTGWKGRLPIARYPRVVDPPGGIIWNGNSRMVGGADYALLGESAYVLGARQQQVRDGLLARAAKGKLDLDDMLAVQLDDRAVFLDTWRGHLIAVLKKGGDDPLRARALHHLENSWTGRASPDSVGYRLVRALRKAIFERVLGAITLPAVAVYPDFTMIERNAETALWTMLTTEPAHLLHPGHESWTAWQLAIIDEALAELVGEAPDKVAALDQQSWGASRPTDIAHPLAKVLPVAGDALRAPTTPLPGDTNMPRVQSPNYGASMDFAVAPGREGEGYLLLPGGQSGHPLSPHFQDQFADWAAGRRAPLQPGPAQHTLTLRP